MASTNAYYFFASPLRLKFDHSVFQGEEGIIFSFANVWPWMYSGSPLPHQNGASQHRLSRKSFHTQPLPVRIPSVP